MAAARAGGRRPPWPGFPALELPGPGGGGAGPEPTVKDGPEARDAPSVRGERRREAGEWGARGRGRGAGATCGLCGGT